MLWAIVGLVALPSVGASAPPASPRGPTPPQAAGPRTNASGGCALVNYTSTVDAFPLSYFECLPTGFSNGTGYPLAIFLHGLNETATKPQPGGYLTLFNTSWVPIAAAWGYILLIVNTRTGTGFYTNSPYTGPQEQDVWDAIHSEESRRSISALYLFGSSMGTMGTSLIAGQTPAAFKGIGEVLSFSDYFEEYDYLASGVRGGNFTASLLAAIDGGALPNQSATARRMWLDLSQPRLAPQNFSGLRQYIVHGGDDPESPNNPAFWPYEEANATVLNRTCQVVTALDEPQNCTQPLTVLHALQPSQYLFRYIYEPDGVHTTDELNLSDMFAFWAGAVPPGVFWSSNGGTPAAPPASPVNFATVPATCGSVAFDGRNFTWGGLDTVANGSYALNATPCAGYRLRSVVADGNATLDGATGQLDVRGSAVVIATFTPIVPPPLPNVTFYAAPSTCAPLIVNGSSIADGTRLGLANGTYGLVAAACPGQQFANWTLTGAVAVGAATANVTTIAVAGNGTVTAEYRGVVVPPPPHYLVNVAVVPDPCDVGILIGGAIYPNGSAANLTLGQYALSAESCPGYSFTAWNLTGAVALVNTSSLDVDGNGTVVALLQQNATPPGHRSGPPATNNSSAVPAGGSFPWLPVGLIGAGVLVVAMGALVWRGRSRRVSSAGPSAPTEWEG